MSNIHFVQFIIPEKILVKQKTLKTSTIKGNMTIRIYPILDNPTSKQADVSNTNKLPIQKILE
ncbi:MepB family protein [Peribacillus butanolivorans]|uniref:MepB family protein n=1 Tax=Peribacillus butanolivorans TaxID=421767 RepID=UPI0036472D73